MPATSHALFDQIYAHHQPKLDLRGIRSRPVLVVFSAIPGSGKSELTKRLMDDYGFLRIANKDIREAVEKADIADNTSIISSYTLWFLDKLTAGQQPSIVFDRNIDQWYEPSRIWAEAHGYDYVLVRIDVSRDILERRLLGREGTRQAKAFEMLDFYDQQHTQSDGLMLPRTVLKDDYDLDAAAREIASY
jgi:adenylate kinase family enzyme